MHAYCHLFHDFEGNLCFSPCHFDVDGNSLDDRQFMIHCMLMLEPSIRLGFPSSSSPTTSFTIKSSLGRVSRTHLAESNVLYSNLVPGNYFLCFLGRLPLLIP